MKHLIRFILVFIVLVISISFADDGMWMPHQMSELNLKKIGLEMNPDELYKKDGTGLMSAIVSLGGGTGEFVSKNGLILTNHHVAFGALQRASDPEHDYIENGFIAWKEAEEIPAQGYIADVLLGYEEVTKEIEAVIKDDMTYREIYDAIDKKEKELVAEAEKASPDLRCYVASMYSGNQYYLFKFKRLKDIRLVYAPPRDLGNFGGDIDNWMWPRHTCDFAFLRAYVSKDNVGNDFSEDNVPYQPKSFLKVSLNGVQNDDFTFVMGYPGRTYRNYTVSQLQYDIERMRKSIDTRKDLIAFFEKAGEKNKAVEIKYAGRIKGLNNGLKNYQGKLEGVEKIGLIEKKIQAEQEFMNWVNDKPQRNKKYYDALNNIDNYMEKYARFSQKRELISGLSSSYYGSTVLYQAHTIYRAVQERQKPDMERESMFQDRNWDRLLLRIKLAERGYDFETDRAFFKHQLKKAFDQPSKEIPQVLKKLIPQENDQQINDFVDELYQNTKLGDVERRLEYIALDPDQLMALKDPMIELAAEFEILLEQYREQSKALGQEGQLLRKVYLAALLEMEEGKMAPDANGTIRFTYGDVKGYSPKDAVYYQPLTSLSGVMEKETGEFPFRIPDKLKQLYAERNFGRYLDQNLNDVPACFLNTTNVTGGNSGSPTLNAKGEQVGIIFDMTYESMIGDYYVIPELQRTISVDIRYVLFVTDKFSGAQHLIKEMGL